MWITAFFPPTVPSIYSNSTARLPGSISVHTFNNTRPQQEAGGLFVVLFMPYLFPGSLRTNWRLNKTFGLMRRRTKRGQERDEGIGEETVREVWKKKRWVWGRKAAKDEEKTEKAWEMEKEGGREVQERNASTFIELSKKGNIPHWLQCFHYFFENLRSIIHPPQLCCSTLPFSQSVAEYMIWLLATSPCTTC